MRCSGTTRRPHRLRAFTLVEVLVVVSVIAIASAIVVPIIGDRGQWGIQAASRIVITDILYAQNEAIAHQKNRRIVFDRDNNRYSLTDELGTVLTVSWKGGSDAPNYIVEFSNDRRFAGVTITDVQFGDDQTVIFDALGTPDTGGFVELTAGQTVYRVSVAPITGRVTVQEQ